MQQNTTNKFGIIVLGFLALVFIEAVFFSNGNFIFLLLGGGFFYYGYRHWEKWTMITGAFFIVLALLSLWSLRLLLLAFVLYMLMKMWKGMPVYDAFRSLRYAGESVDGMWKNRLFSIQSTPYSDYEWEDIHMQGFFGNIRIDVTDTVLPKRPSYISIRQGIGKVLIELPYDIPVRIHYSTLYGEAAVFNEAPKRLFNGSIQLADGYENKQPHDPELIINVFTWIGDVEVLRK